MTVDTLDANAEDVEFETADAVRLVGRRWMPRTASDVCVVLVHGFASHQDDAPTTATATALVEDGYQVLTYDGRGHGASEGSCTLGDQEELDVAAAVALARKEADRIVVVGASMGAVAVLRYAADVRDVAGVVTISSPAAWRLPLNPRTLLATVLTRTGVGRRLADRYMNVRLHPDWSYPEPPRVLVQRLVAPVAIVHGRRDRFISFRDGEELYRESHAPSRLFVVDDMAHGFDPRGLAAIRSAVRWTLEG